MDGQNDRNSQDSPQSQTDSCGKVRDAETSGKPPASMCVKPAQLPLEGVLVARRLTRVFAKETERARQQQEAMASVMSRDDQLRSKQCCVHVHVMVVNFSHEENELPKGTILGVAEETSASIGAAINEGFSNFRSTEKTCHRVNMVANDSSFK